MSIIGKLVKTAINIVELPVAIVKDAATLGGELTDRGSYTAEKVDELDDSWNEFKEKL